MTAASTDLPVHDATNRDHPPSTRQEIDDVLATLGAHKDAWAALAVKDRRAIVRELLHDFGQVAAEWAEASRAGEGIPKGTPTAGEEWVAGPYLIQRNLQLLDRALRDIERYGRPRIPGPVTTRPDGQVVARVFPETMYDRILYSGVTAEVWMQDRVKREDLAATQAVAYHEDDPKGATSLVLGAGNVSSIGPMDALYKLFVDNQVVVYKLHPLNAYLGPLLARGFQALVDWNALRLVYGGADVGAYLCEHPQVDTIHITGSDKTVEAIVFGPGEEGARNKAARTPTLDKPISSELGNVSPLLVVPGAWSAKEIDYQAENMVASLVNNAGFNCNASRVIVTHQGWPLRDALLERVRHHLNNTPTRHAYYPGASDRHASFITAHPEAECFGAPENGALPWTLVTGLDPEQKDDICYRTEAFCGVWGEVAIPADDAADFLAKATAFANDTLWGTLSASIMVHPKSLDDPGTRAAFDEALAALRYGTIGVNVWSAIGYGLVIAPWGGYPGHDLYDIQSGTGVVHNTLMFDQAQKTVVKAPFRMSPKPMWFPSHRQTLSMGKKLTAFETQPSPFKLPGLFWDALRG